MAIKVDQSTCADVCTMLVISPTEDRLPRFQDERARACIACGHCEAYCPTGALTLDPGTGPTRVGGAISPEQLGLYLKSRRSVRQYRPDPVPSETIRAVLDVARYAASGGNGQPVEWLVVHDPREVRKVAGLVVDWMGELAGSDHPMSGYVPHLIAAWEGGIDVICRDAPHLLIPHVPEANPIAPTDAIITLTHVDVVAPSFGLGTCWAGFVAMASRAHGPLREYYALPEGRVPAYAMMLGYPRYTPQQIPERRPLRVTWRGER